jgi:hypothetical protein
MLATHGDSELPDTSNGRATHPVSDSSSVVLSYLM